MTTIQNPLVDLLKLTVGFDNAARQMLKLNTSESYPPYNIDKIECDGSAVGYRITIAAAGFREDQLNIRISKDNILTIHGTREDAAQILGNPEKREENGIVTSLHRGIGSRSFFRSFQLNSDLEVSETNLSNGLLTIDLRVKGPSDEPYRNIPIGKKTEKEFLAG